VAYEACLLSSRCLDVHGGPDSGVLLSSGGGASSEDGDGRVHALSSSTSSNRAGSARADDIASLVNSLVDGLGNDRGVARAGSGSGSANGDSDGGSGVLSLRNGEGRDGVDIGDGRDTDDLSDNGTGGKGGSTTTVGVDSAGDGRVDSGGRSGTTDVLGGGGSRDGQSGDLAGDSGGNNLATIVGVVLNTDSRVEAIKASGVGNGAVVRAGTAGNVEGGTDTLLRQRAEINTVGKSLGKTVVEGLTLAQGRLDVEGGTDQERRARDREGNVDR
jgi:hypothetical protein